MVRKIERFGKLLSEGIVSVAKRQGKKIREVEQDLATQMSFTYHAVEHWRKGFPPREPEQIAFLARYCLRYGRVDRAWLNGFLVQADYPIHEREVLLAEVFPPQTGAEKARRLYQNLPPRYGELLGREKDMARVMEGLHSRWPLVAIEGMAGVGKTTLTLEVALRCLSDTEIAPDQRFQAVVWVSAKDRPEQQKWLEEVLDTIARVLDCIYVTLWEPTQKIEEVNKLLKTHRVLVIVDNYEVIKDPHLEQWLFRLPEPSKGLLTTRHGQMRSVWAIHLTGLEEPEALTLIRHHIRRLGLRNLEGAADVVLLPLARVTEGNPKAIELALGYIKRGMLSLTEVVDHLHRASESVNTVFDYLFSHTWEKLDPDARYVLLAAAFFVDQVGKAALGAVASLGDFRLDLALGQLVELSFLDSRLDDSQHIWYAIHPLVRAFSQSQLGKETEWRLGAEERWIQWFEAFLGQYNTRDWPAHQKLLQEQANIFAAISWALHNRHPLAPSLVKQVWHYVYIRGLWRECEAFTSQAIKQLEDRNDPPLYFWLVSHLGWLLHEQERWEDSIQHLREVESGILEMGQLDLLRETDVLNYVAQWHLFHTRYDIAENYETRFLEMAEQAGDQEGVVVARYYLALIRLHQGQYQLAEQLYANLLPEAQKIGWERAEGYISCQLGEARLRLGKLVEAKPLLDHARGLAERWGEPLLQARAFHGYARMKKLEGAILEARLYAEQAYDIYHRLGGIGGRVVGTGGVMSLMRQIDEEMSSDEKGYG